MKTKFDIGEYVTDGRFRYRVRKMRIADGCIEYGCEREGGGYLVFFPEDELEPEGK